LSLVQGNESFARSHRCWWVSTIGSARSVTRETSIAGNRRIRRGSYRPSYPRRSRTALLFIRALPADTLMGTVSRPAEVLMQRRHRSHLAAAASLGLLIICSGTLRADEPPPAEQQARFSDTQIQFFETEIRPLLSQRCWKCHSEAKQQGG